MSGVITIRWMYIPSLPEDIWRLIVFNQVWSRMFEVDWSGLSDVESPYADIKSKALALLSCPLSFNYIKLACLDAASQFCRTQAAVAACLVVLFEVHATLMRCDIFQLHAVAPSPCSTLSTGFYANNMTQLHDALRGHASESEDPPCSSSGHQFFGENELSQLVQRLPLTLKMSSRIPVSSARN